MREREHHELPSANTDAWNTADGQYQGKPRLLRYRPNLKKYLGDPEYPRRLIIIWDYESENSSGLPSSELLDEMRSFEDAVVNALDIDRCAVLAFILTQNGVREWHFYLDDVSEVGDRINESLTTFPKLPLHLQVEEDSNWDEMRAVLELCEQANFSK